METPVGVERVKKKAKAPCLVVIMKADILVVHNKKLEDRNDSDISTN